MKADNHIESSVRVCAALRCPGNLTVKSRGRKHVAQNQKKDFQNAVCWKLYVF